MNAKSEVDDFGKSQRNFRCDGIVTTILQPDDEGNQCGASKKFYGVYN